MQRSKFTAVQMTADYRGDMYTYSLTLGNPDILTGSGKFINYINVIMFVSLKNLHVYILFLFYFNCVWATPFSGVFVFHGLYGLTPSLAVGGELAYQRGPGIPGGQVALLSGAARYTIGDSTWSGSFSKWSYIVLNRAAL